MEKRYLSQATYQTKPVKIMDTKKVTQPNMSLSIKEILNKYAQGGRINAVPGIYTGDQLLPDVRRMDYVDVDALKQQNEYEIKRLTEERDALIQKSNERNEAALKRSKDVLEYYEREISKRQSGNEGAGTKESAEVR